MRRIQCSLVWNCMQDIPQQMNGSDCGMFACKFAEYITRDARITFSQVTDDKYMTSFAYYVLDFELFMNVAAEFVYDQ